MPVPVNIVSPPLAASSRPVQVPVNPHPVNTNRVTLMSPTVSAASPSASVTSPRVIQIPSTQSSSNNSFSSNQASPIITNTFASPSMKMNTLAVGDTSVSVNSSSTHPIPLGIPGSSPQCTYSSASVTYPNYSNAVNLDTIVQSILEAVPNQLPANSPHSSPRQNKTYPNSGYFQERTNPNYTQKIFNQHIQQQHQQQVHQQYQQQQQQHYQQPHKQPLPIQPLPIQPLQQQLLQQQLLQQHLYQMQQQLQPQLQQQQQQREQMQIQREQMQHLQQQQQREQMQQLQQQQQREQRELTLQLAMASQQHQQQQHYQIFQKQHKGQNIMKNQQYLQEQLQKIQNMTHNRTPSNPEPFRSPQPNEITFAFENNLFTEPEPSSTNKRPKHNHPNNGASLVAAAAATLVEPPRMTERDLMNICRPFENLMEPFKLQGRGYKKARKLFYLSRHMFKRVFLNPDHYHKPMTSEDETPVKFYLFGYNGMAENKCAWPPDVEVSVNNKRLQLSKITKHQSDGYVTQVGKDLPYNLKDQIIAGENELTVSYSHDSCQLHCTGNHETDHRCSSR
ncbi:hypothetical protein BDB01DRAFT_284712 [Pilobolus umbonatus]|nr:hypothetical protein BDB01DRAFT_284712 [Pilobolus umbonatus]